MITAQILQYAAIAAGYALALARLTDTARPLWAFLPVKLQPFLPALLVVLPELATGLQGVKSVQDIINVVLTAAGALMVSMRGAVPAAHYEQLSPSAKKEIAAVRSKTGGSLPPPAPAVALFLATALALTSGTACSSAPKLTDVADKAGAASRLVVPMSKDALKLLRVERDRLVAEKLLTGTAAADVDAALLKAEGVLERVERKEKVTREELLKAIDAATLVNDLLVAAGAKPPPLVASAIDLARRVVDEAE